MELSIHNLSKTYDDGVLALDGVSLDIPGGVFGLLGPNGAGKSTLMRILATLQEPDEGSVFLDDIDLLDEKDAVRRMLGYLPQDFGLYPNVSAFDLLDHIALLKGLGQRAARRAEVERLLHQTNLYGARHKLLGGFSTGMRQRFGIAQALLGDPRLVIVDEPTAGLDPEERVRFHNLVSDIGEERIVLFSTHIVPDVAELCANMAILHQGRVLMTGPPPALTDEIHGKIWTRHIKKEELAAYRQSHAVISSRLAAGRTVVHVYSDGDPGIGFQPVRATLEDVYFSAIAGLHQPAWPGDGD